MKIKTIVKKILRKICISIKIEVQRILGKIFSLIYNSNDEVEYKNEYVTLKLEELNIIDIVVVAFNNFKVIEKQYELLKMFIKDRYSYTIFDNSTKLEEANKIKEFCGKNQIPYIKLKRSLCTKNMISEKHAVALNYIYKHYLKVRHANYIGFLDHDIFPIKSYEVKNILDRQQVYGYMINKEKISYIWPGFCFFKLEYIFGKKVNFLTDWKHNGDTGACNYKVIYKELLKKDNLVFATHERKKILDGDNPQNDMYSVIDGKWIHMLNAGNWKKTKDFNLKQELIFKLLDEAIEQ